MILPHIHHTGTIGATILQPHIRLGHIGTAIIHQHIRHITATIKRAQNIQATIIRMTPQLIHRTGIIGATILALLTRRGTIGTTMILPHIHHTGTIGVIIQPQHIRLGHIGTAITQQPTRHITATTKRARSILAIIRMTPQLIHRTGIIGPTILTLLTRRGTIGTTMILPHIRLGALRQRNS